VFRFFKNWVKQPGFHALVECFWKQVVKASYSVGKIVVKLEVLRYALKMGERTLSHQAFDRNVQWCYFLSVGRQEMVKHA
jgi:hypothetical protein